MAPADSTKERGRLVRAMPLLLSLALVLAGCGTPSPSARPTEGSGGSASRVDRLNLVAMPVAVSLTSQPGVDGIVIKIYAEDLRKPKTQPIRSGVLQVLMFDGLVRESFDNTNLCRHLWSFPATELSGYTFTSAVGAGYSFPLGWGKDRPRQNQITIVARYLPPQGTPVYSAPSFISMPAPVTPAPALPSQPVAPGATNSSATAPP